MRVRLAPAAPPRRRSCCDSPRSVGHRARGPGAQPTAPAALSLLARDADERVRILIARKLAPGASLSDTEQPAAQQTIEALAAGAGRGIRVRAAIADVVKDMPNAPRELALRLAHDTEIKVSDPVIRCRRCSPGDLLALSPHPTRRRWHWRRAASGLTEEVADALAASEDPRQSALLLNRSAQIREATLDALIARAADHTPCTRHWFAAPTCRRGPQALSCIVADTLLASWPTAPTCHRRSPPSSAHAGRRWQRHREWIGEREISFQHHETIDRWPKRVRVPSRVSLPSRAVRHAGAASAAGAAMLAVRGVPLTLVQRRQPAQRQGLVSLVWKAGFSMKLRCRCRLCWPHCRRSP